MIDAATLAEIFAEMQAERAAEPPRWNFGDVSRGPGGRTIPPHEAIKHYWREMTGIYPDPTTRALVLGSYPSVSSFTEKPQGPQTYQEWFDEEMEKEKKRLKKHKEDKGKKPQAPSNKGLERQIKKEFPQETQEGGGAPVYIPPVGGTDLWAGFPGPNAISAPAPQVDFGAMIAAIAQARAQALARQMAVAEMLSQPLRQRLGRE